MEMQSFRVTLYTYDVWGNAEDGYDVNDIRKSASGTATVNPNRPDDVMIRDALEQIGRWIDPEATEMEWTDENTCEVSEKNTGKPLGRVEFQTIA